MTTTPEHATHTAAYQAGYNALAAGFTDSERAALEASIIRLNNLTARMIKEAGQALHHVQRGELEAADEHGEELRCMLDNLTRGDLIDVCGRLAANVAGYLYAGQIGADR